MLRPKESVLSKSPDEYIVCCHVEEGLLVTYESNAGVRTSGTTCEAYIRVAVLML